MPPHTAWQTLQTQIAAVFRVKSDYGENADKEPARAQLTFTIAAERVSLGSLRELK
jgi:hypothetical protein